MPDTETIAVVSDLVPEVMESKAKLQPGWAGIILIASIPPLRITTTEEGKEVLLRDLHYPRWKYKLVIDPAGQQDPIPAAGQEIDRVRYYLALAAGHRIPVGAYVYTHTSHAPVYRGWDDMFLGVFDPFEIERLTDDQIYATVQSWYSLTENWLAIVPRNSVLDVAIEARMRGFFAADRRDGFIGAYACLESLAKGQATRTGWLDPLPAKSPWLTGQRLDWAIDGLLGNWAKEQAGSARSWRKARTKMIHPITGPPVEQEVWNLVRPIMSASRGVLLGILSEAMSAR